MTTSYDVKLNYVMGGDAAGKLDMLGRQADKAATSLDGLKSTLRDVGLAIGVGMLFEKGKEAFIGFNAEMEQLKIGMGAIIQMDLGGTFQDAQKDASAMFAEFQRFSTVTPLMTKDIISFGNNISAAVLTHGGGLKDLVDLTERGAVAAKVFGVNADFAGVEMQHLLAGDISSRMRFINALMAPTLAKHGMSKEQFKHLDDAKRLGMVKEALNDPGLVAATKSMEKSFEGVWSTFKDKVQIALGQVGLPLFKAVTAEIGSWVGWLDKNEGKLKEMGASFGSALATGFRFGKQFISSLVEHKAIIMGMAAVFGGRSLFNGANNFFGGIAGSFGMLTGGLKAGTTGLEAFQQRLTGAAGVVGALGLLYTALVGITAWWDQQQGKNVKAYGELGDLGGMGATSFIGRKEAQIGGMNAPIGAGVLTDAEATMLILKAKQFGAVSDRDLNSGKFREAIMGAGMQSEQAYLAERLAKQAFQQLSGPGLSKILFGNQFGPAAPELERKASFKKDKDINVRIDKIEVASDDPDRLAYGLIRTFEDLVKNPVGATDALRGGL